MILQRSTAKTQSLINDKVFLVETMQNFLVVKTSV